MKQFGTLLFIVFFGSVVSFKRDISKRVAGVLISSPIDFYSDYPQQTCDSGKQIICKSCSSYSVCLNGQEIATQSCGADAPNCNQKVTGDYCSPTVDTKYCESTAEKFTCSAVGVFPDPKVCQEYHHCMTIGDNSFRYKCPPGYEFDYHYEDTEDDGKYCRNIMMPYACAKVLCNVKFDDGIHSFYGFIDENGNVMSKQRKYYGLCTGSNANNQILMFKCSKNAHLSSSSYPPYRRAECVYECEDEGKFSNSNNPATYYLCYNGDEGYKYEIVDCPKGYLFNSNTGFCDIKDPNHQTTTSAPITIPTVPTKFDV